MFSWTIRRPWQAKHVKVPRGAPLFQVLTISHDFQDRLVDWEGEPSYHPAMRDDTSRNGEKSDRYMALRLALAAIALVGLGLCVMMLS
jgi:hypothetical protein